eukprot:m.138268 g.138268  ORF g.138268 m.138268 type:complete len:621 (+) comp20259_c0_seq2:558-2420(+)
MALFSSLKQLTRYLPGRALASTTPPPGGAAPKPKRQFFKLRWLLAAGALGGGYYVLSSEPFLYKPGPDGKLRKRQKLLVLGSGWGAVALLREIDTSRYDVTCVSPRNFFLMTPLLPSVAVGTIEARTVCEPIRTICGEDITYLEAECTDIDPVNKIAHCRRTGPAQQEGQAEEKTTQLEGREAAYRSSSSRRVADSARTRPPFDLSYDKLVVCVGAESNTFGIAGVEKHAHFLKEVIDAQRVRAALSDCFESAIIPGQSKEERHRLLHFVVVGGGPTGVEFAAELADMIHEDYSRYFPEVKDDVKITLVEALDHILSAYDKQISEYTTEHFRRASIDVAANTFVKEVKADKVVVQRKGHDDREEWPCAVVVWATGIKARPLIGKLRSRIGGDQTNRNALLTDKCLRVKGADSIFSMGDCASIDQPKLLSRLVELFKEADTTGAGALDLQSFRAFVRKNSEEFPQLELYAKDVDKAFASLDTNADMKMSIEEFKEALHAADSKLRALPATAQVAVQEGKYLSKLLNHIDKLERGETKDPIKPFRYTHLGSLAYIGGDYAVIDLTGVGRLYNFLGLGPLQGRGTFYLWKSFYFSTTISTRLKMMLAFDWTRTRLFGRDLSRV